MKKFLRHIFTPSPEDNASNTAHIYNLTMFWIFTITSLVMIFLCIFLRCNLLASLLTFLMVAAASFAGGAAIGFLFGLPRAEKFRFVNKDTIDHNLKEYGYGDNTNLEEVSDWLTKIMVGLTLIKLNTIINWINLSAISIQNVFSGSGNCKTGFSAYVFGYCTIILYFLAGAGLCYLWARTNLSVILTRSKREQQELEKRSLLISLQKLTNTHLQPDTGISTTIGNPTLDATEQVSFPTPAFKNTVLAVYNSKPVYDKTDIQKKRWGGEAQKDNFIFEATYLPQPEELNIYKIKLSVRMLNAADTQKKEIAFFLHDTFPSQIVFSVINNNSAEIQLSSYEAFVAGAYIEGGPELELDLNKVQGFPEKFYWKE